MNADPAEPLAALLRRAREAPMALSRPELARLLSLEILALRFAVAWVALWAIHPRVFLAETLPAAGAGGAVVVDFAP